MRFHKIDRHFNVKSIFLLFSSFSNTYEPILRIFAQFVMIVVLNLCLFDKHFFHTPFGSQKAFIEQKVE